MTVELGFWAGVAAGAVLVLLLATVSLLIAATIAVARKRRP